MRPHANAAIAVIASLTIHSVATAQSAVDEAHATANRLLNGAGGTLLYTSGKVIESVHTRISSVRRSAQCTTSYATTIPDHPDVPAEYRNNHNDSATVEWATEMAKTSISGARFYYEAIRERTGRPFTYHFQFASPGAAAEFAAAAKVLAAACASGDADEQAAEEAVHDPLGNSASLAIDRRNGSAYGWAIDHKGLVASDRRALAECNGRGRECQVVLRFTGGCGAYAADQARGSSVYGWGTAASRSEAEGRAQAEARKRGGTNVITRVWGCNSVKASGGVNAVPAASERGSGPGTSGTGASGTGAAGRAGTGLSDEVIRRNAEAQRLHQERLDQYERQLKANEQQIQDSRLKGRAAQEAHDRELAKASAARAQYERERQAYREEYRRVTGRYPDQ